MTFDSALRSAVTSELCELMEMHGSLPSQVVNLMAEDLGTHPSTLRRWVSSANGTPQALPVTPRRGLLAELSDDHIEVVFQYQGDLRKAKKALDKVDADIAAMSESTFRRRWAQVDPAIRAMAVGGAEQMLSAQLRILYEPKGRNHVWHIDSMECPVWVLPEGHTTTWVKPWMVTVEDGFSRRIMAILITMGRPNADDVVVVLADAMRMKPLSVEGEFAGGVPECLHSDNGSEFKNLLVKQGMARLGVTRKLSLPYHKHQNGKVERLQQTIQDSLMKPLPGYSSGPKTMSRRDIFGTEAQILTEESFTALTYAWVDDYNAFHEHSSLGGRTPNQVWCADDTPLQSVDPEALRLSLLEERRSYKVHPKGIHFNSVFYTAPELATAGLVGSKVQVRYLPRDPSFIEVFSDGEWVCTAFPHANLTDSQREAIKVTARRNGLDARTRQQGAAKRRLESAVENPDVVITEIPQGPPTGEMVADELALLALVGGSDSADGAEGDAGSETDPAEMGGEGGEEVSE